MPPKRKQSSRRGTQKLIGVDLFAGAGGMSLGAMLSGISIKMAIENNPHAAATYLHNHPQIQLHNEDIRNVRNIRLDRGNHQTIVFGGPPCKGFSTSNQRTRTSDNPNNQLYREFLRIVRYLKADWVVFENVKGIIETDGRFFLNTILDCLSSYGYTLNWAVLNASDFDVPQNRSRLFIVGSLHGIRVDMPVGKGPKITVKEAIADLPKLANGASICRLPYKHGPLTEYSRKMRGRLSESCNHLVTNNADHILKRYRYVPPGGNWEDIPSTLMRNYSNRHGCHTGIYHRLDPNLPSKVIGNYRKNMVIHPDADRGLSVREAARLQSFPDWFQFKGSIGFQQEQVGNAVPPLLAKAVFDSLVKASQTS
jgi:DNA (cytosine-5)-methyltransferase 1